WALQALAAWWRETCGVPVVGVTGSTGKTTTKDMIAAVLGVRMPVWKTPGNLNNEIGLPLTLLGMEPGAGAAVVEMAMRGEGEIAALCEIARPTAAVLTNIGETHLERLGSVDAIARAKGELLAAIGPGGFAVVHAESPYAEREAARCRGRVRYFGRRPGVDFRLVGWRPEGYGTRFTAEVAGREAEFVLPVPGEHNVLNALAAIGVGFEMGLDLPELAEGLRRVTLSAMRLEILRWARGEIINDAYNANPASTRAALAVLSDLAGGRTRVAVLGDMLELGPRAEAGHREVGQAAARHADYLVAVGALSRHTAEGALSAGLEADRVYWCADREEAAGLLRGLLRGDEMVLVKGSRGMRMEEIVAYLLTFGEGTEAHG
ncbi:MAG: UDP-N-acetylmuramoyl-tripeptide--D-alanyl-D-alanine ligase, partial [Firmicutes bacterium]|nr:UDP-N-acetylmuramoyl-tripeptide--D-alanyl-D-alanine ligase [Bacillota bacterium]